MALEFALRPRFNLERPSPRPRRRVRLLRLALPIAGYWLGIAGVTLALLRLTAEDAAGVGVDSAPRRQSAEVDEARDDAPPDDAPPDDALATQGPSLPAVAQGPAAEPPLEPAFEAALVPAPPLESQRVAERTVGPSPPEAGPPEPSRPEPASARQALIARPPAPPVVRPEPRVPARPFSPIEEGVPSWSEAPKVAVAQPSKVAVAPAPKVAVAEERKRPEVPATSLPSCESAAAAANETLDLRGSQGAPDLSREALASVLENGAYLGGCGLPPRTTLDICAAVRDGKVVGVTATTEPRSPTINACVRRAVAALSFPQSARLDVTRTRFQAAR